MPLYRSRETISETVVLPKKNQKFLGPSTGCGSVGECFFLFPIFCFLCVFFFLFPILYAVSAPRSRDLRVFCRRAAPNEKPSGLSLGLPMPAWPGPFAGDGAEGAVGDEDGPSRVVGPPTPRRLTPNPNPRDPDTRPWGQLKGPCSAACALKGCGLYKPRDSPSSRGCSPPPSNRKKKQKNEAPAPEIQDPPPQESKAPSPGVLKIFPNMKPPPSTATVGGLTLTQGNF